VGEHAKTPDEQYGYGNQGATYHVAGADDVKGPELLRIRQRPLPCNTGVCKSSLSLRDSSKAVLSRPLRAWPLRSISAASELRGNT
jgi:hypothetical protein